jgi:2-dehydro-3-deoxy-D-arabinonate dehydratase
VKLYYSTSGVVLEDSGSWYALSDVDWDQLVNRDDLAGWLRSQIPSLASQDEADCCWAPIGQQEVWAAGVTYLRSREARMEESSDAGGSSFYDRVYDADRPELFFKSLGHRVVGDGGTLRLRADSKWQVPEPELAILINKSGKIVGYTIGNDLSCRDIEGENPLYLPQAKVWDGSCALGPALLVAETQLPKETSISLAVRRRGTVAFAGATTLARMKRDPEDLANWLTRELSFPWGCYLLTGTGIVPRNDFSLAPGDEVMIRIDGIGELLNTVTGGTT